MKQSIRPKLTYIFCHVGLELNFERNQQFNKSNTTSDKDIQTKITKKKSDFY